MVNLIPTSIVSSKKKLFQDDSSQFWKKAREHYVTSGHVTDVTSDYGVTSGHVTDVTSGYEDTSGRVTDVTSGYDATSISTEQQQQQYSQSNNEESYYILKTNNLMLLFFENLYTVIYYGFSLLHIFSLVLQPWMSAYIRKTDGVYISVPKND